MKTSANFLRSMLVVAMAAVLAPTIAPAVYPETGMYVDLEANSGRGFYIEVQNDTLFLVIYAYDEETGQAEIYTAASEIRDDAIETGLVIPGSPPPNPEGYFPVHWMFGKLYRVTNGPCITCNYFLGDFETVEVGDVAVFFPFAAEIRISFVPYDDIGLTGDLGYLEAFAKKQNFGLGKNIVENDRFLMHDVMGQWLFADQSDPDAQPWRFHFDERIPEAPDARNRREVEIPFEVTYRDSRSGAEFRCAIRQSAAGVKVRGCELHHDGQTLFSARYRDIGATRIRAFRGELPVFLTDPPLPAPEFWRGPDAVIGVRIETPPDLDVEP